jgi:antitoxin component YwqK of YwqJK toxin-antitoxin module
VGWYDNVQREYFGAFERGEETGSWTYWWPTGQKKSEGLFVAGKRSGPWRAWNQDGTLNTELSGEYREGRKL